MKKLSISFRFCGSRDVIKKGKQRTKFGVEQVYYCRDCERKFADRKLVNKSGFTNI